eukprot:Skav217359  [mRNA]  locus=scaffold4442:110473:116068:+ [translate_table: standard]
MAKPHATLIFSRHGESQWNVDNRFTGWVDLSAKGLGEAKSAGGLLKTEGIAVDMAFTSYLKRAIKTCDLALESADQMHVPVTKSWRLNERMYGALTGLDKKEIRSGHPWATAKTWRVEMAILLVEMVKDSRIYPPFTRQSSTIPMGLMQDHTSPFETKARVMPFWEETIAPALKSGKTVFVAAHGNSIRAILKFLEGISDNDITGCPLRRNPVTTSMEHVSGVAQAQISEVDTKPLASSITFHGYYAKK